MLLRYNRPKLCFRVVCAADLHFHSLFLKKGDKVIGDAFLDANDRECHASHTCAAVGRVNNGVDSCFQVAVLKHKRMVFRFTLSLYPLAMLGGNGVNMLADACCSNESDCLNTRILQKDFSFITACSDQIYDTLRESALRIEQLEHAHRCKGGIGVGF